MAVKLDISSSHQEVAKQSQLLAIPNKDLAAKYARLVPALKSKPNAGLLEIYNCVKTQKASLIESLLNGKLRTAVTLEELKILNKETGLIEKVEECFKARNLALEQMSQDSPHTSRPTDLIELSKIASEKA